MLHILRRHPVSKPFRPIDFKSKKIRINLNLPIKAEAKAEANDVLKTVDEDRKYVIQATIVRYVYLFYILCGLESNTCIAS